MHLSPVARRALRVAAHAAAALAGAFLGFAYVGYAYWYAVGMDIGGIDPDPPWDRVVAPGVWLVYRLGGPMAQLASTLAGGAAGLVVARAVAWIVRGRRARAAATDGGPSETTP